jgi:hypothetical protein
MKFLTTLVWVYPRIAGDWRVSVAMIAPYEFLDIDATGGIAGAARSCWLLATSILGCGFHLRIFFVGLDWDFSRLHRFVVLT